jgi:demethylmenaquinone methyltransferase/2-methoxy-6-polyprenyl-1,4-benzoquinol methylase
VSDPVAEQKRYYAERAPEYDDWWYRRGRYELEPDALARWRADVADAEAALEEFAPGGTVLALALNTSDAELVLADVFEWEPAERFDLVFFSFWLSHVPEERFDEFWSLVRDALVPGGRVFLVDSGAGDTAHTGTDRANGEETRSLADGRTFRIVKRRWLPGELAACVRPLGFELDLRDTANGHFLYGGGVSA